MIIYRDSTYEIGLVVDIQNYFYRNCTLCMGVSDVETLLMRVFWYIYVGTLKDKLVSIRHSTYESVWYKDSTYESFLIYIESLTYILSLYIYIETRVSISETLRMRVSWYISKRTYRVSYIYIESLTYILSLYIYIETIVSISETLRMRVSWYISRHSATRACLDIYVQTRYICRDSIYSVWYRDSTYSPFKFTPFCLVGLVQSMSLSAHPRALLCKRHV